ncbi:MAG: type IX secretion system sortase PorU [Bacteroidota bacterium]
MKRTLLSLLLAVTFSLSAFSQVMDIDWTGNGDTLVFRGASYPAPDSKLPWYNFSQAWTKQGLIPDPVIRVIRASEVEEQFYPLFGSELPPALPELEYTLSTERKKAVIQLALFPFFTTPEGRIMKLEKFSLETGEQEPLALLKGASTGSYSENSVLAAGNWYKIRVSSSGIHKLSYEQLQQIGLSNPALVRIYGAGAVQLPEDYSRGSYDDLSPLGFYMDKGSDNLFGPGDFILFYARGPVEWNYDQSTEMFVQHLHDYSLYGCYFLTDSQGASADLPLAALSSGQSTHSVTSYDLRLYREKEQYNLLGSGREWFDDVFSLESRISYPFALSGPDMEEPVKILVRVAAQSNVSSYFSVKANNSLLGSISIPATNLSSYTSTYAFEGSKVYSRLPDQETLTVTLEYSKPETDSRGWLNYITVNARAALSFSGNEMVIADHRSAGYGNVAEFSLDNAPENLMVWEITDETDPARVNYTRSGTQAIYRIAADEIRTFIAFRPDGTFPSPEWESGDGAKVENQNLHGLSSPDLIIVCPPLFLEQAERLADHRRVHDNMEVAVITEEQVFNEFSSGTPNVAAIRNFLKMFYDRGVNGEVPAYLLLFGDGSVDNRTQTDNNPNMILTYQSEESLEPVKSYVSDDFYGLLDTGEQLKTGLLDIGIGRFPVSTTEEAEAVVDKIIAYDDPSTMGDWRNYICFIGDDEDGNIHMQQADQLAQKVETEYPAYNINKIYLDAFPQVSTPTGERYPDVTQAINDQMNRGALIINYTGHGGTGGLAHEQILTVTDINNWTNRNRLPLFMTATCEFSRYDEYDSGKDLEKTSAGEDVLLNPDGGGIGLFTTTRLVYSQPNFILNEKFYEIIFKKDSANLGYRLGDIIAYSKNKAGTGLNKLNFTLLGDPSQKLVYPGHRVLADSVNHITLAEYSDTISALDFVTVSGHIETCDGAPFPGFNGVVYPVVFDKSKQVITLANDGGNTMSFNDRSSVLYKGKATVAEGKFSFGFYVPKDINYLAGTGKISFYANDSLNDAHGATSAIVIGGDAMQYFEDDQGPEIAVYMNDTLFRDGGITDPDPELLIRITDNYGINTTGNGIGHDITATLDGDRANSVVLNNYYQAGIDSYRWGEVRYPYADLEEGLHHVNVKAWDIHNNSAEFMLSFIVVINDKLVLDQLFNYPNPFRDETYFNVTHNRPDQLYKVTVEIYNISGGLEKRIVTSSYSSGYRIDPVYFDGKSDGGSALGEGIYIYRVTLENSEGETATGSGRLLLIN